MFTWNSSYVSGNAEIDTQHQELICFLNQLFNRNSFQNEKDKVKTLVEDLYKFAWGHFAAEELYMQRYHYPELENHAKEHEKLKQKISSFRSISDYKNADLALDLLLFMKQWISIHLSNTDYKFHEYMHLRGL